ncbi:MAG TPA: response regulator [Candidatus Edwardsbacteria bacterium]|nr:response regulator [Candidatus Edwardsbacteria bacterium]
MRQHSIMIIDDDRPFAEELAEMLALSGYRTEVCCEGDWAVEETVRMRPDVILLDVKLDRTDGHQLALRLRQQKETRATPIIMMSAYFIYRYVAGDYEFCNIRSFLVKPFQPLEVIARIERALPGAAPPQQQGAGMAAAG